MINIATLFFLTSAVTIGFSAFIMLHRITKIRVTAGHVPMLTFMLKCMPRGAVSVMARRTFIIALMAAALIAGAVYIGLSSIGGEHLLAALLMLFSGSVVLAALSVKYHKDIHCLLRLGSINAAADE